MKKIAKLLALTLVLVIMASAMAVPVFATRQINKLVDSTPDSIFDHADILVILVQERRDLKAIASEPDANINWSTTDSDIARVSDNGIVKTYKKGTCYIIADYVDANGSVYQREAFYINSVNNLQENYSTIVLNIGDSFNIVDLFMPALSERTVQSIQVLPLYTNVNKDTGVVTARKAGEVTITVTFKDANDFVMSYPVHVQILED